MTEGTLPNGKPQCQEVGVGSESVFRFHQCQRPATVDGKWCKYHDPVPVAMREAALDG